jgi:hypothetical protein
MNQKEETQVKKDLNECHNIGEMFNYLSNYFDLFSKNIPVLLKPAIVTGIVQAIKWIDPKRK